MPAPRHSVIAADDHPIVRSGIRLLLEGSEEFGLVAESNCVDTTREAVRRYQPTLLILDLWMDERGVQDGLDLIHEIRTHWSAVQVLVYSMNDERIAGRRALQAGAAGYLRKTGCLADLLMAMQTIVRGNRYVPAGLAAELIGEALTRSPGESTHLAGLTARELQVLRLIGAGRSTAFISECLHISPKTVGAHRENLKNKLRIDDGAGLIREAVRLVESHLV